MSDATRSKPYFVILNCQNPNYITPLVDDDEEVCMFESYFDAEKAGAKNVLGDHYGFEVFQRGQGEWGFSV